MNKAVFIDKDGTLIPDIPYNVDPDLITLENGAAEGLLFLKERGYLLIVISNQGGAALGYFNEAQLDGVKERLKLLLKNQGIDLNGFYYCPHHPLGSVRSLTYDCECRKPKPGLLLKAAAELDIDLSESWMIGDILNDVEAGNKAGCHTILINNGNETEWLLHEDRRPEFTAASILQAAGFILNESFQFIE